jgi:hypothetical protein
MRNPTAILSYRFRYAGEIRHVDNVTLEEDTQTIIGMEIRKRGRFSWKIKRYAMERIDGPLERIDPLQTQKQYDKWIEKAKP